MINIKETLKFSRVEDYENQTRSLIILTIWSDVLSSPNLLLFARDFASRLRQFLRETNIDSGRIYLRKKIVAEIEFALRYPGEHAFGEFSGYEIKIPADGINPKELKKFTISFEDKSNPSPVDIDVYVFKPDSRTLIKHSRHSKKPRLISRKYSLN